ncbi:PAS domain S-box protein [Roseibacillus persicicus]|uniref:PAS domain S-box protein n=1 Tax=Roseibacillus persicicus TaxID=454148 RepID=UPI00398A5A70
MSSQAERLVKRQLREKTARLEAERLLEEKSLELFEANQALEETLRIQRKALDTYQTVMTALADVVLGLRGNHQSNIHSLLETAGQLTGAHCGCYALTDEDRLVTEKIFWMPEGTPDSIDENCLAQVLLQIPSTEGFSFLRFDGHSFMAAPILDGELQIGFIIFSFPGESEANELCRAILELIAHAIGVEELKNRTGKEREASEQKYRELFHASVDGIVIHDMRGRVTEASDSAVAMLGYTREALRKLKIPRLFTLDSKDITSVAFRQVKTSGRCRYEAHLMRSDGSTFPAEIVGSLFHINGKPHVHGIIRDISSRREAQVAAIERERKFRAVFESSLDGIILHDMSGQILDVNSTLARLVDREREEFLKMELCQLYPPDALPVFRTAIKTVRNQGKHRFEIPFLRANGSKFLAEVSCSSFELGNQTLVQGIVRDITEKRRKEEEIRMAKEEAERANKSKSLFLATMSHEIRTPLNGIIGFAELLAAEDLPPNASDSVAMIQRSGDLLLGLITDLLDLSKIESDGLVLSDSDYNLRQTINDILSAQGKVAKEKGIELKANLPNNLPDLVTGDPLRVRQVISNLVGNAVKFTEVGSVELILTIRHTKIHFEIVDTGPGFPNEVAELLFENFFQVDQATTKNHGGAGLGLAICRKLVNQMGGSIKASSTPGVGSRFSFNLPLRVPAEESQNLQSGNPLEAFRPVQGVRLLVAEDQKINARLLGLMLDKARIKYDLVNDGQEALEQLATERRYDAVLMDVRMPRMDGLEATRRIRKGEAGDTTSEIPIVAVTANAMDEDHENCVAAGMTHFLSKPIRTELLVDCLVDMGLGHY